jgi:glycosyltransferase involved in cell wall biosynthesis
MLKVRRKRRRICTALGPWAAAAAIILARLGWVAAWIYVDRDYEPGFVDTKFRRRWVAFVEVATMRRADAVITIGRRLGALRTAAIGREPILIPTGVDFGKFACRRSAKASPILLYTGNVADWAALDVVIAALPAIRARVSDARLIIVGSGPAGVEHTLREAAQRASVEAAVTFLGSLPYSEMPGLLTHAAIGLATFRPTFLRVHAVPLKLLEYMAAGLPVLVTVGTEAGDIVTRAAAGHSISLEEGAIADAATAILSSESTWRTMSENGQRYAAMYDWKDVLAREWSVMGDLIRDAEER